ncbi:NAD(+) diphosphatase [Microbacterium ulmi]|uniref:NAD(+) diphosphatase n=1 Tax=Microbacterium ulmi TaxID=179095 RepID=A0A7Y2M2E6_9MICO|nr:NAD(+) diphosphatase [Microbacterium ulmi]NII71387.1 NAD+ diphosphatase [Microbacterium ulmi]NNH05250.1 NAD(+) diphosphatase [Microbacterium ulmi]
MTAQVPTEPAPLARAGLDRAADERTAEGLLDALRADPRTRVLVLSGDAAPLSGPGSLLYVEPERAPRDAEWAFLGRDANGAAVVAAVIPKRESEPFAAPSGWASLRAVGGSLSGTDAGAFVEALSLGRWLLDAPFCPACGALTMLRQSGWSRRCPSCGREHFPRTDPAVIVAITSARHPDRLLLGSNSLWEDNRYSCFAGFAEAGESLEAAVAREVREEAGIDLVEVRYRGSQAWPYPRSLMLGFLATAVDDESARADGDEIAHVRWFDREEIGEALAGGGDILLPGRASIAHRLISDWHANA